VFRPAAKYHVPEIAGIGGGLLLAAAFTYWMSHCPRKYSQQEETDMLRIIQGLKDLKDNKPSGMSTETDPEDVRKAALIKKIEDMLNGVKSQPATANDKDNKNNELDPLAKFLEKIFGKI